LSLQGRCAASERRGLLRAPARLQVEDALFQGGQSDVDVALVSLEDMHAGKVAACELLEAREDLGLQIARKFLRALLGCLDFGLDFCVYDGAYLFEVFWRHWLASPGCRLDYA